MNCNYIVWPSARVLVQDNSYYAAVDAIKQIPFCFFDGESIFVPESETTAISMLCDRFLATVEYGHGQEAEFATKAKAAGVEDSLISLGHSLQGIMAIPPNEMVINALANPESTWEQWRDKYLASFE